MTTTQATTRSWLEEAQKSESSHLIVVYDAFDREDYPIPVPTVGEFYAQYDAVDGHNRQHIVEVYDLSGDIEAQLAERRAYSLPPRPEASS